MSKTLSPLATLRRHAYHAIRSYPSQRELVRNQSAYMSICELERGDLTCCAGRRHHCGRVYQRNRDGMTRRPKISEGGRPFYVCKASAQRRQVEEQDKVEKRARRRAKTYKCEWAGYGAGRGADVIRAKVVLEFGRDSDRWW